MTVNLSQAESDEPIQLAPAVQNVFIVMTSDDRASLQPNTMPLDAHSLASLLRGVMPAQSDFGTARADPGPSFANVANEWFENSVSRWARCYSLRLRGRLDCGLIPALGHRPISHIGPLDVLEAVRSIERRGALATARRVLRIASAVFRYGVATGRCKGDPTADLKGALKPLRPVRNRASLTAKQLPRFLQALEKYGERRTRLALELVILTFVRTSELRFASWAEFEGLDGPKPLWRIPAERMKMRRPHLVPLSPRAVEILGELRVIGGGSGLLFPAKTRSGVICENTLLFALYRMGYRGKATVHGFRSTASTVLNEAQFNRDWIEAQLAHSDGSVRGVYNGAEWLHGRRKMMAWWAEYLNQCRSSK